MEQHRIQERIRREQQQTDEKAEVRQQNLTN